MTSEYTHNDDVADLLHDTKKHLDEDLHKAADEIERLQAERDQWKRTAEVLARELGHVDIAKHEYRNQEGVPNGG